MKFFLLINIKMPKIVGILTFMSSKNGIICLSAPEKAEFLDIFILMSTKISSSAELSMKKFYNLDAWCQKVHLIDAFHRPFLENSIMRNGQKKDTSSV